VQIFDADTSGLVLRVTERGHKSWYFTYRWGGKFRWLLLGEYPSTALVAARKKARAARKDLDDGQDPRARRQATLRAALSEKTFREVAEAYLEEHARPKKRSWRSDERLLFGSPHRKKTGKRANPSLVKRWGDLPAKQIQRSDVREMITETAKRAPIMANRLLACVRKVFNFALEREWVDANPCALLKPASEETPRNRVLSSEELALLWASLERENSLVRDVLRVLLLTAQRSGEVFRMRWDEVELDETTGWWTLPAGRTKNNRQHRVWLSEPVRKILGARRPDASNASASPWVFTSSRKSGSPVAHVSKAVARLKEASGVQFRPHDLRRTAATRMAAAGVDEDVLPKVLGHVPHGVTRRHYNLYAYDNEKRAALDRWADIVDAIVKGAMTEDNVVSFRAGAA
jgi:integrase